MISSLTSNALEAIKRNLLFVLLLEVWRPETCFGISMTMKLSRILCVFLTGKDI